jgi:hypothetical protein
MVGPGSYRDNQKAIDRKKIKGGKIYASFHQDKQTQNNSYVMIGNHLVYDSETRDAQRNRGKHVGTIDVESALLRSKSLVRPSSSVNVSTAAYTPKMSSRSRLINGSGSFAGSLRTQKAPSQWKSHRRSFSSTINIYSQTLYEKDRVINYGRRRLRMASTGSTHKRKESR